MANPAGLGGFKPGVSGNPSGRSKELIEIRDLARTHSADALAVLKSIALDATAPASSRVAACEAIITRGFGRPGLSLASEGDPEPLEIVVKWAGQ